MTGDDVAAPAIVVDARQSKSDTASNRGISRNCFIGGFFSIFGILESGIGSNASCDLRIREQMNDTGGSMLLASINAHGSEDSNR
jgi:hypothetical protein